MTYLLDTSCCIKILKNPQDALTKRFFTMGPARFAVCTIVQAELEFGAFKSVRVEANLRNVRHFLAPLVNLPFDSQAATAYGQIRAALEQQGTPVGGNDIMIAAVARVNDLVILTDNLREYARIPGLLYDQWL
jgi:tRNA(fMet)-specific endonuclease VapC